jgi:FkbM family methyltransferase
MMAPLLSGRGSVLLSGQAAAALAEALTGEDAKSDALGSADTQPAKSDTRPAAADAQPAESGAPAVKRSRAALWLHRVALATKPYLQPMLRRVEARIGTAVNKSGGVISLQSEVAAVRAAVEQTDGVDRLRREIAALRATVARSEGVDRLQREVTALRGVVAQADGFDRVRSEIAALRAAIDQSGNAVRLQRDEIAALRAAVDQSDNAVRLQRDQIAGLRVHVDILLQRFIFPVGEGMLAARNRYGYLVLPTTDLANVGYLAEGVLPEQGSLAVLETLLAPGDVFVDLGANVGLFTLAGARCVGATGHVHAVEPAPDLVAALGLFTALNQIAAFVTIHPVAAGATEGEAELFLAHTSGHNSLYAEQAGLAATKVRLVPLDALITPGTVVSLVKMDVEGAELQALAGMARVIADNPRIVILAEFSPSIIRRAGGTPEGWIEAVRRMGFDILEIDEASGTLVPLRAQGLGELVWVNLALCRPEGRTRLAPLASGGA